MHHQQQEQHDDKNRGSLHDDPALHGLVLRQAGAIKTFAHQIVFGGFQKSDDAANEEKQRRGHGGDQGDDENCLHGANVGAMTVKSSAFCKSP